MLVLENEKPSFLTLLIAHVYGRASGTAIFSEVFVVYPTDLFSFFHFFVSVLSLSLDFILSILALNYLSSNLYSMLSQLLNPPIEPLISIILFSVPQFAFTFCFRSVWFPFLDHN